MPANTRPIALPRRSGATMATARVIATTTMTEALAATSSRLASNRAKLGAAALARLAPTNASSAPASRRRRSMPALR